MEKEWVYDIETYLDIFAACFVHVGTRTRYIFEVSDRIDQSKEFTRFCYSLRDADHRIFGFNNEHFDYPVIHLLIQMGQFTAADAHRKAMSIIRGDDKWGHVIWPSDRIIRQGDLFKIHHFDNVARSTSLKKLEINMRSRNVVDLPYPADQPTTSTQKDEIIQYMCHDVSETLKFYHLSRGSIAFRDKLVEAYPDLGDVINFNDTKIGKKFFERELERAGTPCYVKEPGQPRQPRQTIRDYIDLRDVISPRVTFQHPEFRRVLAWFQERRLTGHCGVIDTKGAIKGLHCTIDGFRYDFGTGGVHGSVQKQSIHADDEWQIWDWDVASYYPNLAIVNKFYPAHLSESFCEIYRQFYERRRQYKKGTAENAILKLALNGVYGDSNNRYSPFFDPQYTMAITVNGQLMLCMLAEWLRHEGVKMIQINTDGLTVRVHRSAVQHMRDACARWESHTGLSLESAQYRSMHVRDVNSYIAAKLDGSVKRIGAFRLDRGWHQDQSNLVSVKAAESQIMRGVPVADFIRAHRDPFDFMLSIKVPRSSKLEHGGELIQNTSRYYVSTRGAALTKIMPPLPGKTAERRIGAQAGWTVKIVNDASRFSWDDVNWLYYIEEARKLLI